WRAGRASAWAARCPGRPGGTTAPARRAPSTAPTRSAGRSCRRTCPTRRRTGDAVTAGREDILGRQSEAIPMRLTRLHLENFKACRQVDLQLAPLTVLIGGNNAGKSSILHCLALLAQSISFPQLRSRGALVDLGQRLDALVHR